MPRTKKPDQKPIEQYDHKGKKRVNNPPVGLVTDKLSIPPPLYLPALTDHQVW